MKQATDAQVLRPRPDAFEAKHAIEQSILSTGQRYHMFDHVEYPPEGGIYVYYKGMPFPKKGFPFPEAVWQNDIMKRIVMTMIKSFASKSMILPIMSFAILPWKVKVRALERILNNLFRVTDWLTRDSYLKEERYSNPARALRIAVRAFLLDLGITEGTSKEIALLVANVIEYDDAYRYRIQDIMTETSKIGLTEWPLREVRGLMKIFLKREKAPNAATNIKALGLLATIGLMHPRVRRAFRSAIRAIDIHTFAWLQLDDADRYQVLFRGDYDYLGRSMQERRKIWIDCHTYSNCCKAGVVEKKVDKFTHAGRQWETACKKCFKTCEWTQEFPPEVEIAHTQTA